MNRRIRLRFDPFGRRKWPPRDSWWRAVAFGGLRLASKDRVLKERALEILESTKRVLVDYHDFHAAAEVCDAMDRIKGVKRRETFSELPVGFTRESVE